MPVRYYVPALGETAADAREIEVASSLPGYAVAEEIARAECRRHVELDVTPPWPLEVVVLGQKLRQKPGEAAAWVPVETRWRVQAMVGMQFDAEPCDSPAATGEGVDAP